MFVLPKLRLLFVCYLFVRNQHRGVCGMPCSGDGWNDAVCVRTCHWRQSQHHAVGTSTHATPSCQPRCPTTAAEKTSWSSQRGVLEQFTSL